MADQVVQIQPDSTGKKIDVSELTVSAQTVERQRINLADPTVAAALAVIKNATPGVTDYGLVVRTINDSGSPVALSGAPGATNAGSATTLTFASSVNHVYVFNNTAAVVGWEWDGSTATAGSDSIAAGAGRIMDIRTTAISLFTAAAQNINGSAAGNIIVKGWT